MANQLKMGLVNSIRTLLTRGWSRRRIARELGVNRETVGRYAKLGRDDEVFVEAAADSADPKPAKAPTGSSGDGPGETPCAPDGSKPARAPTGSDGSKPAQAPPGSGAFPPVDLDAVSESTLALGGRSRSASHCEPLRAIIEAKLALGLTAQRIYQDLVAEHGFTSRYHSVRRFVARLREGRPLPFRRMECAPGEQAQVDFGTGAPIVAPDGKRRRAHVLRVVLSHSRKGYSEAVFRQTTDALMGCLENAFRHFGGAPKTLVLDNLRAAVQQADWYDPELNPRLESFARHYGTVILPIKPYTPRHQGKIERGIGYVKGNALKGRTFGSLADENVHLLEWETRVADTRIHGTTRKQVGLMFREVEQAALLPLPVERFPFFHEAQRSVHRDAHVEVDKAYYSVPPEYVGRRVWVRWDGHLVRVFTLAMEPIVVHAKHPAGRFSTRPEHIHSQKISGVERGSVWLLGRASRIGPHAQRWAQAMLQHRGIQGVRVLMGLVSLAGRYPNDAIEKACQTALSYGAFRLKTIRELIKRGGSIQETFEFLETHEIIRDIAQYGQLVREAIRHTPVASDR